MIKLNPDLKVPGPCFAYITGIVDNKINLVGCCGAVICNWLSRCSDKIVLIFTQQQHYMAFIHASAKAVHCELPCVSNLGCLLAVAQV